MRSGREYGTFDLYETYAAVSQLSATRMQTRFFSYGSVRITVFTFDEAIELYCTYCTQSYSQEIGCLSGAGMGGG